VVDNCDRFNAARGFQVIAMIFAAAALLVQLVVACAKPGSGALRGAGALLGILAAVSGLICMSLWANLRNEDSVFRHSDSSELIYGFWLTTAAWVIVFLAAFPFCTTK
jgi:hypothetical protein